MVLSAPQEVTPLICWVWSPNLKFFKNQKQLKTQINIWITSDYLGTTLSNIQSVSPCGARGQTRFGFGVHTMHVYWVWAHVLHVLLTIMFSPNPSKCPSFQLLTLINLKWLRLMALRQCKSARSEKIHIFIFLSLFSHITWFLTIHYSFFFSFSLSRFLSHTQLCWGLIPGSVSRDPSCWLVFSLSNYFPLLLEIWNWEKIKG